MLSPTIEKGEKVKGGGNEIQNVRFDYFSERECNFSLSFRAIRPSEFFKTRSKAALRNEAYAWAPVLRSFDKLREVGVSSYLSFTLCLSVFMMLEFIEVVSGRLIGPKFWNRIVRKFGNPFVQSVTVHGLFGLLIV